MALILAEAGPQRIVEIDARSGNVSEIAGDLPLPIGRVGAPSVGVGASIYVSSDIENAIYKLVKK
jgi:hypothetical protein